MEKRAIITGAGGFIGSHLATRLKKEGFWVRGIDLKYPEFSRTNCDEFIIGDLRDPKVVEIVIPEDVDELFTLACDMGGAGYIFTGDNDANVMHNSAMINLNVANECVKKKVKKVFFSSSACIYPEHNQLDPNNPKCVEGTEYPANPDSQYGWEKLFSERLYLSYNRNYNLDVRICRYHNIFGPCFDDETEVLTNSGWKYFKDVTLNDKFATLNNEKKLIYLNPIAKQGYPYNGKMYKIKGRSVDQLITPDHNIYVSTFTTKYLGDYKEKKIQTPFELRKVSDIKWDMNSMFFTSYFKWEGENLSEFYELKETNKIDGRREHPSKKIKMLDWFEFVGWYVTEGSSFVTPTNYTVCITQYEKANKKYRNEIKDLLNRMGIHYSEDKKKYQIIMSNKQIYNAVKEIGKGAKNKKIPEWMLNANKKYLIILFETLMKGDGNKNGRRFNTTSKILKDQFMELSLKLSKTVVCSDNEKPKKENHNQIYRISLSNRKQFWTKKSNRSIIDYDGMVYDVTLPKYHVLLIRRNGKVCWSGNCGAWNNGKEKAPAAICRKVAEANNNSVIEIWGLGDQTRSFLYIDECLEATLRFMRNDNNFLGPVNIGSEEMISINDFTKMIINISGKNLTIKNIPGPEGVRGRNSDNKLYKEKMNWVVSRPLREGMEKLYKWIENQIIITGLNKIGKKYNYVKI